MDYDKRQAQVGALAKDIAQAKNVSGTNIDPALHLAGEIQIVRLFVYTNGPNHVASAIGPCPQSVITAQLTLRKELDMIIR